MSPDSMHTALAFVQAINTGDPAHLRPLMTPDHTFTDALGHSFVGATVMSSGWRHFFRAYPGYRITVDHTFAHGDHAALFGRASGGWRVGEHVLPEAWSVRAAWLAHVVDGRVATWSIFCDTAWATPPISDTRAGPA